MITVAHQASWSKFTNDKNNLCPVTMFMMILDKTIKLPMVFYEKQAMYLSISYVHKLEKSIDTQHMSVNQGMYGTKICVI